LLLFFHFTSLAFLNFCWLAQCSIILPRPICLIVSPIWIVNLYERRLSACNISRLQCSLLFFPDKHLLFQARKYSLSGLYVSSFYWAYYECANQELVIFLSLSLASLGLNVSNVNPLIVLNHPGKHLPFRLIMSATSITNPCLWDWTHCISLSQEYWLVYISVKWCCGTWYILYPCLIIHYTSKIDMFFALSDYPDLLLFCWLPS